MLTRLTRARRHTAQPPAEGGGEADPETAPARRGSFPDLLRYFLYLGTFGFGGPIATVGYMQRDLVERRRWLDRQDFLNGVALGQMMPGPLAAQVAMWVGYLRRGALGAAGIALPFILPSFVLVIGVAVVYVRYQGLPAVQSLFYGVAPGVMAIIVLAAIKLARLTNRRDPKLWGISAAIMVVTAVTGAEIALLFISAGLLMVVVEAPPRWLRLPGRAALAVSFGGSHPGGLLAVTAASVSAGTLATLGFFFLKAGAFIFGSGLAIVPFLREGVVHDHHWLTERQFLDAVAMGLISPGPVVITAAFIGYLVAGFAGAAVATVAIFTPIYLGVVIPGRWFIRHRENAQLKAFVKGATAAAAGAIAGATIVLIRGAVVDVATAGIALGSLALIWKLRIKEPFIVLGCACAGLLLHH
jgi:chromate transporter